MSALAACVPCLTTWGACSVHRDDWACWERSAISSVAKKKGQGLEGQGLGVSPFQPAEWHVSASLSTSAFVPITVWGL